jgi:hypothetical protein
MLNRDVDRVARVYDRRVAQAVLKNEKLPGVASWIRSGG